MEHLTGTRTYHTQGNKFKWKITYVDLSEALVEDAHVEVETLVDESPDFGIFRIESVIFGVLVDEVAADGATLVQNEIIIDDRRNVVLRIDLDEFGFQMLTSRKIDHFEVEFDSDHLGGQPDRPARCAGVHVIQIDRHFLCL